MKKFLVVGTQRTGSSALVEGLNQNPRIACGGAWIFRCHPWKKVAVLDEIMRSESVTHRWLKAERVRRVLAKPYESFGFRCLFRASNLWWVSPGLAPSVLYDRLSGVVRWLRDHPDTHVIQIVRRDELAWLASKYLSKSSGYYVGGAYPTDAKISIPVGQAISRVRMKRYIDSELSTLAATNPYVCVEYEAFRNNNRASLQDIYTFLGVPFDRDDRETLKIQPQSRMGPEQYVSNYQVVARALSES